MVGFFGILGRPIESSRNGLPTAPSGLLQVAWLSESGFAGFSRIFRIAGVTCRGLGWVGVCSCFMRVHESLREFADCLNQDLLDFHGFSGWSGVSRCGPGWEGVCSCFMRVHESLREFADCLNQDLLDFHGFSGWRVSPVAGLVGRVSARALWFTRVYESLRIV